MKNNIININGNPFLQRSAEDELDFLEEIYYKPVYYDELIDNAINGASRMLVGQRGLGKSATIHFLFKELKQNRTLPLSFFHRPIGFVGEVTKKKPISCFFSKIFVSFLYKNIIH